MKSYEDGLLKMNYCCKLIAFLLFISCVFLNAKAYETKRFSDCIFSNMQNGDGLLEPKVKSFLKDHKGFMWFVTPSTLQRFDGIKIERYVFDDGVKHSLNCITETSDGNILAGGGMGIWQVDAKNNTLTRYAPNLNTKIHALSEFGDKLLACGEDGLYSIERSGKYKKISDVSYIKIIVDLPNRAYLLATDGLFCLTGDKVERIGNIGTQVKFTCMSDADRTILIGTDGSGIYGFDKITNCFRPLFEANNQSITVIDSNKDRIVLGIKGGGIQIIDKNTGQTEERLTSHPDAEGKRLLDDNVASIMIDDLGIIWIGYDSYVGADYIQYRNKSFHLFNGGGKIPYELAYYKCEVNDTSKKFVTAKGTYICDALGIRFSNDIAADEIANGGNLVCEDSVTFSGKDNKERDMKVVRKKDAYVFDEKIGHQRRICTPENDHFLGINIEKILQDANNNYWIIGSRGVIKVNPELTTYTLFSTTEGLTEPYASDGIIYRDTLWVVTPHGVYFMDINATPDTFTTRLIDININGLPAFSRFEKMISEGKELRLKKNETNIEFSFATLSYDNPYKMLYEYKLEKGGENAIGGKEYWTTLRGINHVEFKNLEPGRYTFTLRKQMDNSRAIIVNFEIEGKSYFLYWMIAVVILASVAGCIWIIPRQSKKSDEEEAILAMSTSEANENPYASEETAEKYKYNILSDEDAEVITARLKDYMETGKEYFNPDLKLNDVAKSLEVTPQVLSQTLNTKMNIRFNDYVNQLRINAFKEKLEKADKSKFTLESLALQCGFNSYSTFIRAFKKIEGITPNDYIKSI